MESNFFDSYNARYLEPAEVADRFIWSKNFDKLIQKNHSVILGARGCGKTTLMKMLTLPAIYNWKGDKAEIVKNELPFYTVYISTDIYWDIKNHAYGFQLQKFKSFSEKISHFAVNSTVFLSVCDTFQNIIEYTLPEKEENQINEEVLCEKLKSAWKLSVTVIPRISYVKEALKLRIDSVNQIIQSAIFNIESESDIADYDFFDLSFESSVPLVIDFFENIFKTSKKKWALCFDELEFAPIWLQKTLFRSLRSRNQNILYKLSASPILPSNLEDSLLGDYPASAGNDFTIIKMWNSDNEDFSRDLIKAILQRKKGDISPKDFFHSSEIYNSSSNGVDGGYHKQLYELIEKDDAFALFLKSKNIDIKNPTPKNTREKDTIFRKIKPLVYHRNQFIERNKIGHASFNHKMRSRKNADVYSGLEVLEKICDGNPRWLIGITNAIIDKTDGLVSEKNIQNTELTNAASRFKNVVANIPVGHGQSQSLVEIIDNIGEHFQDQILGEKFNMDPYGTFIVDESKVIINDELLDLLEKGVSQGALILTECLDDSIDFQIRGKRFKLSYLFHVFHRLPIRKYSAAKLSDCLTEERKISSSQYTLFQEKDQDED